MSDSMLFIARSIHQGHQSFSHISRGRQCSFISFSALLFARNAAFEQWTAVKVDQILDEGDRLYLNALRRRSIPDTGVLSLNYLPNVACWSLETNSNQFPSTTHQDDSLICMAIRSHFVIMLSTLLQCCIVIVMQINLVVVVFVVIVTLLSIDCSA